MVKTASAQDNWVVWEGDKIKLLWACCIKLTKKGKWGRNVTVPMLKEAYFDREDLIIEPGALALPDKPDALALPDYPSTQQIVDDTSSDGQGDNEANENDIADVDQLVPMEL